MQAKQNRMAEENPTFCFVYEPAPGHSVMISSLASLLVAKAKATPEKVVPCRDETVVSDCRVFPKASHIRFDQGSGPRLTKSMPTIS